MTKRSAPVLLTLALMGGFACRDQGAASALVDEGWNDYRQGRKEEALATFRLALQREPDSIRAHRAYQVAMTNSGRYTEMKREYEVALESDKGRASAYFWLAYINDDYPESKRLVKAGLKIAPEDARLRWLEDVYRVNVRLTRGQPEKALELLEEISQADIDLFTHRVGRASGLISLGRLLEAQREADAMVREHPFSPEGYLMRSGIHYRRGAFTESLQDIRRAGELGDFAGVHAGLGAFHWQDGRIEDAKAEFRRALDSPRDGPGWAATITSAYLYLGEPKKADESARLALKLYPEDTGAKAALVALRVEEKPAEAERLAKEILRQNPDDENGHAAMGHVQMWTGRYPESAESYAKALQRNPKSYSYLLGRGLALVYDGRCDEGEDALRQARKLTPGSLDVSRALGTCSLSRGRPGEAIAEFKRVLRALPEDESSHAGLVKAYFKLERYEEGRKAFETLLGTAKTERKRKEFRAFMKGLEDAAKKSARDAAAEREKARANGVISDEPDSTVVYEKVREMDLTRLLAYQRGAERLVGTPWNSGRPVYRSSETVVRMDPPQWSPGGKTLYFGRGDLLALELREGRTRVVVPRPPGAIVIEPTYDLKLRALSRRALGRFLEQWRMRLRHRGPYTMDRAIEQVRLSRDGALLFYTVNASSGSNRILHQLEAVETAGSRRRVLYPYSRGMWHFEYDRSRDRLLVWGSEGLVRLDPRDGRATSIPGEADYSFNVSLSPDGREMVAALPSGGDAELTVTDLRTGERRGLGASGQHPAWSPDGRRIAFIHADSELRLLDVGTGKVEGIQGPLVRDPDARDPGWGMSEGVRWSPDSRYLAYNLSRMKDAKTGLKWELVTLIADTKRKELWQAPQPFSNPSWAP